MYYADSNFIFLLYKELSGKATDVSVYYDFFMEAKNVGSKFKEKHTWPKDQTWETHIDETYQNADEDFKKFAEKQISLATRNKFISHGKQKSSNDITLASIIYTRFLLVAKETWDNNTDLLKKITISYCHYYQLNPDFISALKKLSFEDIIYNLILEASSTRGDTDSKERTVAQNKSPNPMLSSLLDTQTESKWLKEWLCECVCTKKCNFLVLKWIARYHFFKEKLQHFSADSENEWKKALLAIDECIAFVTNMLDLYMYYLPEISSDKFAALPKEMCIGDEHNFPAFLGELYLIKATLLIDFPKSSKEMSALLRLNHAKKCLLDAEEILSQSLKMEEHTANSKNSIIKPLLGKVFLNRVHLYCQLVIEENHECRINDLYQEYMSPCQKALQQAQSFIDSSSDEYQNAKNKFISTFFEKNNPAMQRIVLPPPPENATVAATKDDLQKYKTCVESMNLDSSWLHSFQFKVEKSPSDLAPTYKTVYSADFDSVLSPNLENSWKLELSIFQIVASGITIVLQLNQITDNIAMLKLVHNPAFQALCRKGMIVLSCYGNILTPETYLHNALKKDIQSFEFSSSIWFNHPKFGETYRTLMHQCLTEQITYANMMSQFPDMIKNDLDFCYDSYRLLLELFPPSTIRQYHQNPSIRYPHAPLIKGNFITLNDAIDSRIKDLREDNDFYPIEGRPDFLDFCTIQQNKALRNGYTTRSEYRNLLPDKEFLKQMTPQYQNYWSWFESLVNYSYCISNGSRSSDYIYNTLTHDMLRLHPEQSIRSGSTMDNLIIKDAYTRYRNDSIPSWKMSNLMNMEDLVEISMVVRNHNLQIPDPDKRHAQLESNTGLKYDTAKSGDTILINFGYNTGNGTASEVELSKNSTQAISNTKDGVEIQL